MNVNMFEHPAVTENMEILRRRGVRFVEPGTGYLACGWLGKGRLAEVADIVATAMDALARRRDMAGETVVVTAGPTVEDIDPVRFVSNRSSGRMGYRLAEAARDRGATVVLIAGPTSLPDPAGIELLRVRSADEMAKAVTARLPGASVLAMAAAVADYRPESPSPRKIKKGSGRLSLGLVRTPDILETVGASKAGGFVVGFAAETEDVLENARRKRAAKKIDLIVANDVSRSDAGFDAETNAAVLIDAAGEIDVPLSSKRELAERIWDRVAELRKRSTTAGTKPSGRKLTATAARKRGRRGR
jgi:phosphopantothenoylcysteine decarboxylase/phosphopantothenate--cysteine ligase